jgi:hypothetical protein
MSFQITTAFVQQYSGNLEMLLRQEGSKLRMCCRTETLNGDRAFYEQIGSTEAQQKASRHSKVVYQDTPHSRRMVTTATWYTADLIDEEDRIRLLINPASDYAKVQADALGLRMDRMILDAMVGSAATGRDGATAVAYDNTNMEVGVQVREAGVTAADYGLNVAKLRAAKRRLDERFVPPGDRYIAMPARQLESVLGTTRATSSDYSAVKALVQGDIDTFLGFKFILSEFTPTSGAYDRVMYWHKSGMLLALGQDIKVEMTRMAEYHYALQVYSRMDGGAVRMQEGKVGSILCDVAAGSGG